MRQGIVLGLTGPSGAGKSTVCKLLSRRCPRALTFIDADQVARQVVEPGTPCLELLCQRFGKLVEGSLLLEDGHLNRRKLGSAVFGNPERVALLNETIFPFILKELREQIALLSQSHRVVVLDAPTLFESGADKLCHRIVTVLAPKPLRIRRICRRDNIDEAAAMQRLASQHPDRYYTSRSDAVIRCDGSLRAVTQQLDLLLCRLGLCSRWRDGFQKGWRV